MNNSILIKYLPKKLILYFSEGNLRSLNAKKNIAASFAIKGTSILINLMLVPLTINYVNPSNYGIWLTISSIVAWVGYFDIGINNGLRNKFAEAKAKDDLELAQKYISTTYALLSLIFIPLLIIFSIANSFIDWNLILKLKAEPLNDLSVILLIVMSYFCIRFILSTICTILLADQKPAMASFINLLEQIVSFVIIFLLTIFTKGSILKLCLGLCITPIIVLTLVNLLLFSRKYKSVAPKFSKVDLTVTRGLLGLGFKFFLLQIAVLIQYQTSNIIIIRYFGALDVTSYNIAFRYFNVLSMILAILVAPFWSAVTEAKAKNDIQWIKSMVSKYQKVILGLFGLGLIMLLFSSKVYDVWLGKGTVEIPFTFSLIMFIYIGSTMIGRPHGMVLNGIGALRLQLYAAIISPVVFLFICYVAIVFLKLGFYSIVVAGIISNFSGSILAPLQYRKIFIENKKGFWTS